MYAIASQEVGLRCDTTIDHGYTNSSSVIAGRPHQVGIDRLGSYIERAFQCAVWRNVDNVWTKGRIRRQAGHSRKRQGRIDGFDHSELFLHLPKGAQLLQMSSTRRGLELNNDVNEPGRRGLGHVR